MRIARHALPGAILAAHLHDYHTSAVQPLWPALDRYVQSAGQQWTFLQVGNIDEAKRVGFEEVSPRYDLMQHQLQTAIDAEGDWAEAAATRARNELLASAVLAAAALLILFLRIQRQEHLSQLEMAERTTLRESEERFRALTEQSTDIILITEPSGLIKYASPSVHAVLALRGEDLVGTKLTDRVHPDEPCPVHRPGEQCGRPRPRG